MLACDSVYRRLIVKDLEKQGERRGRLAEGYDPNMLDVAKLCNDARGELDQQTIACCWVTANCLP